MARNSTGNVYKNAAGRWYARVTLGSGARRNLALPTCATEDQARARLSVLAELAAKLRAAGLAELAPDFLTRAAEAQGGRPLEDVRRAAERLCERGIAPARPPATATFQELAERWTSGELTREYPDHVREKRSAEDDRLRLERHVYPVVGDVPLALFTIDHAEAVMKRLSADLSAASRRHVAQLMHRVLSMAVFPLRLIASNPLPRGFLPSPGAAKAKAWLYPDEDRALLAAPAIPLCYRLLYGFLDREGMRAGEAAALTWANIDLDRGAVILDNNKTDDPRAWALSEGTVKALRAWHALCPGATEQDRVFLEAHGNPVNIDRLAERFRGHLRKAGITRPALFERTAHRRQIRIHDLRATFITLALANGRTEAWVQDRTGHRSSMMINVYRRAARTAAELGLGDLAPLDLALPDLSNGAGKAQGDASPPDSSPSTPQIPALGDHSRSLATVMPPLGSGAARLEGSSPSSCTTAESLGNSAEHAEGTVEPAPFEGGICANSPSPRAAAVATLAAELTRLSAAGDLEGARILNETIGRLLGNAASGAPVVDLGAERARRGL